jgi:hypothetical protein
VIRPKGKEIRKPPDTGEGIPAKHLDGDMTFEGLEVEFHGLC